MPKRTYPDQDGLHFCGAGDGFVNMRQLYTILRDWEAIGIFTFVLCLFSHKPYWSIGFLPAGVSLLMDMRTTSRSHLV